MRIKKIRVGEKLLTDKSNKEVSKNIEKINKKYQGEPTYEETQNPHNVTPIRNDDSWINKNVSFH